LNLVNVDQDLSTRCEVANFNHRFVNLKCWQRLLGLTKSALQDEPSSHISWKFIHRWSCG